MILISNRNPKPSGSFDKNGYPFHQTEEDALTFLNENEDRPFFLYCATWLVHAPIHTPSEALIRK